MRVREDFDLAHSIAAWLIVLLNTGLLAMYALLWLFTPNFVRLVYVGMGCIVGAVFGIFVKKSWEEIFPWVSKKTPTSSSTSLNPPPSSFAQYVYQTPNLSLSAPSPNVSPSLPEFTAETPLVGYRAWTEKDDGLLWAINGHAAWSIDKMTAKCTPDLGRPMFTYLGMPAPPMPCTDAPTTAHTCGLYLLSQPEEHGLVLAAHKADGSLYGAVVAWGRIIRHGTEGFRAQYAKVLCLTMPEWSPVYDRGRYDQAQARTERAAKAYGVPIIPSVRLREYVGEFGTTADKLEATKQGAAIVEYTA